MDILSFALGMKVGAGKGAGGGTSSDERVKYVTFMYGGAELLKYPVIAGDTCHDPVSKGLIATPTKEQTASTVYTFSGWSLTNGGAASSSALQNVTEDRTVYVAFTEAARKYTINFYDGETLLKSEQVAYGTVPSYTPTKEDVTFAGWTPALVAVVGDADYYAQWTEAVTFASSSWAKIAEVCENGEAASTFAIGDTRVFTCNGTQYTAEIVAIDQKRCTREDGYAREQGIACVIKTCKESKVYGSSSTWPSSSLRTYCNETIYNGLEDGLKAVIKRVWSTQSNTTSSDGADDYVWVPNRAEVGASNGYESQKAFPGLSTSTQRDIDLAWHLRSVHTNASNCYYVDASGAVKYGAQTSARYIRFGFCI